MPPPLKQILASRSPSPGGGTGGREIQDWQKGGDCGYPDVGLHHFFDFDAGLPWRDRETERERLQHEVGLALCPLCEGLLWLAQKVTTKE